MSAVASLPLEILQQILKKLSGRDLSSCSAVCAYWEAAVDGLGERFWKRMCALEHGRVCADARRQSGLCWRELHRSLSLWPEVSSANVSLTKVPADDSQNMYVLKNSIISCSQKSAACPRFVYDTILHYDPATCQSTLKVYDVPFSHFAENDDIIAMSFERDHMSMIRVISKVNEACSVEVIYKPNPWLLLGKELFYTSPRGRALQLCRVKLLADGTLENKVLCKNMYGILYEVAYVEGKLYVSVMDDSNYPVTIHVTHLVGSLLVFETDFVAAARFKPFNLIKIYGFDWRSPIFYAGPCENDKHVYGPVIVTMTSPNLINVFYDPYDTYDGCDIQLQFMEPNMVINLDNWVEEDYYCFGQIHVVETVNGHKIILLYNGRIYILLLKHGHGSTLARDGGNMKIVKK